MGPISANDVGLTLIHEHLIDIYAPMKGLLAKRPISFMQTDREKELRSKAITEKDITEEMQCMRKLGLCTVVDQSGIKRDIHQLVRISRNTGLNIVASTGCYPAMADEFVQDQSIDKLTKLYVKEIKEGICDTGVKAGEIKTGLVGFNLSENSSAQIRNIRAAARTHIETNAPIYAHTHSGFLAMELIEILESEGVGLSRVIIGHLDCLPSLYYHKALIEKGVNIGYDTVGKDNWQPDSMRVEIIKRMTDLGYADHIFLSTDISRKSYLKKYGGYGYSYILEDFVPRLKKAGVSEEAINTMLIENPKRILPF